MLDMLECLFIILYVGSTVVFTQFTDKIRNIDKETTDPVIVDFIDDLIHSQREATNIALLTTTKDANIIYQLQERQLNAKTVQPISLIVMDYDTINKQTMERIDYSSKKDNLPPLYVITPPQSIPASQINALVKKLRSWEKKAKIAIIFRGIVNVVQYADENIYNVYLFTPAARHGNTVSGYTQYDVCHMCDEGKDMVKLVNTWREQSGFKHKLQLVNSFKGNFHGKILVMGAFLQRPLIYTTGENAAGAVTYEGAIYRSYVIMEGMLNLTFKFKHAKSLKVISNNTAVGILGDLVESELDIVGGGWIGRLDKYKYADFSAATQNLRPFYIISIEPPKEITWFALLKPFNWYMWLCIICSVFAIGITSYGVRKFSKYTDKEANIMDCIWEPTRIICWESINCRNPTWSIGFLYSMYMLVCLLLVSLYLGKYTSIIVSPIHTNPPIDTFEQLIESDRKILTFGPWHSYFINYFQKVEGIEKRLEQIKKVEGEVLWLSILKKLQEEPEKYVFIYTARAVEIFAEVFLKPTQRKFHYSKDMLPNLYCHLLLSRGFQYREMFNRKILLTHDMGFVLLNWRRFEGPSKWIAVDQLNASKEDVTLLKLKHFLGALALLFSGLFLDFLIICFQFSRKKCQKPNDRRQSIQVGCMKDDVALT